MLRQAVPGFFVHRLEELGITCLFIDDGQLTVGIIDDRIHMSHQIVKLISHFSGQVVIAIVVGLKYIEGNVPFHNIALIQFHAVQRHRVAFRNRRTDTGIEAGEVKALLRHLPGIQLGLDCNAHLCERANHRRRYVYIFDQVFRCVFSKGNFAENVISAEQVVSYAVTAGKARLFGIAQLIVEQHVLDQNADLFICLHRMRHSRNRCRNVIIPDVFSQLGHIGLNNGFFLGFVIDARISPYLTENVQADCSKEQNPQRQQHHINCRTDPGTVFLLFCLCCHVISDPLNAIVT